MNDANSFGGYQESPGMGGQVPQPSGPMNPGQYRFSAEELRVLAECNRESFFQRSLPLGTFLGLGTYAAVQAGHLRPNPRFGPFPKITLAVIVGYFLGKLSYQQACAEKLMNLPGSYIGQLLRDRRDGKIGGGGRTGMANQSPSMFGAGPGDIYSDAGPGSALDLDTERPLFSDDTYRPDQDSGGPPSGQEPPPPRPSLSYEELRRRNRGEYSENRQDPYRMDPNSVPPISRRPPPPPPPTNKYGDSME
ncbi:OCIA domain-containing protein 1 [Amyelois transitella]|uniref:OCIA domain-containing protein 1 n=1 Tax=Amyelois transitella TaxID=680683 RepID=UPI00067C9BE2|nr:OCIA domain-containing protein 1 [Amyelois transitella]